jgi:hypothetical protein
MGITDLFRGVFGEKQHEEEITGVIVEGPALVENGDSLPGVLVFRLDSRPDLIFHQVVKALVPDRKRGDKVRVHCRMNGDDTALVDWVERA